MNRMNSNTINHTKYYQILGINKSATKDEIVKAHKKLINELKNHAELHRKQNLGNPSKTNEKKFQELDDAFYVLVDKVNQERKQEELTKEEKKGFYEILIYIKKQLFSHNLLGEYVNGYLTEEGCVVSRFLAKSNTGLIHNISKRTMQLFRNSFSECQSCNLVIDEDNNNPNEIFRKYYNGSTVHEFHMEYHLKTRGEIEEFIQRVTKNFKEMVEEIKRLAMANKETFRKIDEMRKKEDCVSCCQKKNKNDVDNKQLASNSNKNQDTNSKGSPEQKPLTITNQEEIDIGSQKNKLSEKKVIDKNKEIFLNKGEKPGKDEIQNNSPKNNKKILIGLSIGIVPISLLILSILYTAKKKN